MQPWTAFTPVHLVTWLRRLGLAIFRNLKSRMSLWPDQFHFGHPDLLAYPEFAAELAITPLIFTDIRQHITVMNTI
jgi:hypothetical protein